MSKKAIIDLFGEESSLLAKASSRGGDVGGIQRGDEIHILDADGNPVAMIGWHHVLKTPRIVAVHGIKVTRETKETKTVDFPYTESRNQGAGIAKSDIFDPKMEDLTTGG